MYRPRFLFQTFNRRGLGHLMRGLNIAKEIIELSPDAKILFYMRGQLSKGWSTVDVEFFHEPNANEPQHWPDVVQSFSPDVVVFDTMIPRRTDDTLLAGRKIAYVMRKCHRERQKKIFESAITASVDKIIVPHSREEFGYPVPSVLRKRVDFVGSIVRLPNPDGISTLR